MSFSHFLLSISLIWLEIANEPPFFRCAMSKREANKIRNEHEIVHKAIHLFIEKGDEATSISDIVAETSLAFGTFYNYFRSKNEIWDKIISDLLKTMVYEDRPLAPSIYDFIYYSIFPIMSAIDASPYRELITQNPSSFRDAYFRNDKLSFNLEIFERDMRANTSFQHLAEHEYKLSVYALEGLCLETFIQSHRQHDQFSIEQITEYIARMFERGLAPSS